MSTRTFSRDTGRRSPRQPHTAAETATAARAIAATRTIHGCRPATGWDGDATVTRVGLDSAAAKSLALSNRSAGSLANAVSTAASTPGGIVFRTSVGRSGSALTTFATIAWIELPVNGGSPVSISYVTAPSA